MGKLPIGWNFIPWKVQIVLNINKNKIIILILIIPYFGDLIMSIKNGAFVMPGDKLGIIEQYLLGKGTYEDNGEIKSSVLGNVQIDSKMRTITVKAKSSQPALLKLGDTVYGQITDIKTQRANVNIDCLTDSSRPLALPYMGTHCF